jgi:hypothetical protein
MMAWWTQLLPVFIFKRLAQQCGVISFEGRLWHDAREDILVRDQESLKEARLKLVAQWARENGIESAEAQYKHFGRRLLRKGIREAFRHGPTAYSKGD